MIFWCFIAIPTLNYAQLSDNHFYYFFYFMKMDEIKSHMPKLDRFFLIYLFGSYYKAKEFRECIRIKEIKKIKKILKYFIFYFLYKKI